MGTGKDLQVCCVQDNLPSAEFVMEGISKYVVCKVTDHLLKKGLNLRQMKDKSI